MVSGGLLLNSQAHFRDEVVLLLHGNGTDASTTFTDSGNAHTIASFPHP